MNAVILAGGVRSGQELAGASVPRALWPFPAEPVITGVIRFLRASGVENISICANGKTRMIAAALSTGEYAVEGLHYSEDRVPRGPAGCLKDLEEWLGAGPFVVIQGTAAYDFDLRQMVEAHTAGGAAITVGATVCKADGSLEPAGVYVMNPAVLAHVNAQGYQDIKEQLLPKARASGMKIACHRLDGGVALIHGCEHYLDAMERAITTARGRQVEGMTEVRPGVWVHESAQVDMSVRFVGTAWVGKDVRIEAGAVIVGPVLLASATWVGRGAIVHRTVAMDGVTIEAGATTRDVVYAPGVTVPGTGRVERSADAAAAVTPRVGLRGLWARTVDRASGRAAREVRY